MKEELTWEVAIWVCPREGNMKDVSLQGRAAGGRFFHFIKSVSQTYLMKKKIIQLVTNSRKLRHNTGFRL